MGLAEPPPLGTSMLPGGTFANDVVLVTGGGTGLGKAMAVEFARLGARIGIVSRSEEHHAAGVAAMEEAGAKAMAASADVRDADQIAAAFDAVEQGLGPVTILINNAAGNFPALAEELSPNGWRAVTQIVLDGTYLCSREFAQRRMARGEGGVILNIGATYAWTGGPGTAASAAAKAGVINLTMSLAVEWARAGIRVNAIAPGLFPHEDLPKVLLDRLPDDRGASTIPAGRIGRPHELGWAATYLCSPYAAYVTGHTLVVDGANWLRRSLNMPEFTPVDEQLGKRKDP